MAKFREWLKSDCILFRLIDKTTGTELYVCRLGKNYHMLIIDVLLCAWLLSKVLA